jgi:hypothetical protein
MASGFWQAQAIMQQAGPTLTAAASASCLHGSGKFTFPANGIQVGTMWHIWGSGNISCVVTTPGTARFSVVLGGVTGVFDSGPFNLNIIAKTTLPFEVDIRMTCRAVGSGTAANFMGNCRFTSEAVIASPLGSAGGIGSLLSAVAGGTETAPAVGAGFDSTIADTFDFYFTQTVATGSLTLQQFILETTNVAPT